MLHLGKNAMSFKRPVYKLRRCRGCDYAITKINGKQHHLGKYNSPESKAKFNRLVAEWETGNLGGRVQTVAHLIADYVEHCQGYYVKNGKPTSEIYAVRVAMRHLYELAGTMAAEEFTPRQFKTLRSQIVESGLAIKTVNHYALHVRKCFKLAASDGKIPAEVFTAISTVEQLKPGRCKAHVPEPKQAVSVDRVNAVLPYLPERVADMLRVQLATGMRPNEVCKINPADIDTAGEVWVYSPRNHKTEHHGKRRTILIGETAQSVLSRYMLEPVIFPMLVSSYRRAIARGCETAGVDRFSPQQVRKTFAESIRHAHDLEAAQVLLGHGSKRTTEKYYAQTAGIERAADIIKQLG